MSENHYNPSLYKQESSIHEAIPEPIPETIPENVIRIFNIKDGCEKSVSFKVRIDQIRVMRNKLLKETDYYLLPDIGLTDQKLNDIKVYRKELREFMNKLMNDEMKINIFDDNIERKYFPKLILEESVRA